MDKYIKFNLLFSSIWSVILLIFLLGDYFMELSFFQALFVAVAPALTTGLVTFKLANKSQLAENTKAIQKLSRQLGLNDDVSLYHKTLEEYQKITNDIGRNDSSSLTVQHKEIEKVITKSFDTIFKRFELEDDKYRFFSQNQFDLKNTMECFLKDYTNCIDKVHKLELQNANYNNIIEQKNKEISILQKELSEVKEQLQQYGNQPSVDEVSFIGAEDGVDEQDLKR